MAKIPVFGTVSRAYGFLLGEFGTIVRLSWAPLLIAGAVSYYYGGQVFDASLQAEKNPQAMLELMPLNLLIGLVSFVTGVMVTVALLRIVLYGDRKPGLFVYLWLGMAELRLMLVYVLLVIAFFAAAIGVGLVIALLGAIAAAVPVFSVVLGIGMIALFFAIIWVVLKLSLVAPAIVAERSLGVERSWELMRGNALRMFFILIFTFIPVVIVSVIAVALALGPDFPPFPALPSFTDGDAAKSAEAIEAATTAFREAMEKWQLDFYGAMRKHWLEITVAGAVGNLIQTALLVGVQGNAYIAVAGEPRE